jgi:hypothetical protein
LEAGSFKQDLMSDLKERLCNIVYRFEEFWPTDYFPVYPKLARRILPLHYARTFSSEFYSAFGIGFNRDELNVCVHIRLGDWVPTAANRFIMQIKILFKYLDISIPSNVHVFYEYSKDHESEIQQFVDFFTPFDRANLILHKDSPLTELIDLMLMSDVLMVSESSIASHLAVMSQRPMVFAQPGFAPGKQRGCVQGQHICIHKDVEDVEDDPFASAYADELSLRWEAWNCAKNISVRGVVE